MSSEASRYDPGSTGAGPEPAADRFETFRRERRAGHRRPVDLVVEEFLGTRRLLQRCTDIGAGGMYLTATARPEVGAVMTRRLHLPDGGGAIWFRGEVVHHGGGPRRRGAGIRFVQLAEPDRLLVVRFVLSLPGA